MRDLQFDQQQRAEEKAAKCEKQQHQVESLLSDRDSAAAAASAVETTKNGAGVADFAALLRVFGETAADSGAATKSSIQRLGQLTVAMHARLKVYAFGIFLVEISNIFQLLLKFMPAFSRFWTSKLDYQP